MCRSIRLGRTLWVPPPDLPVPLLRAFVITLLALAAFLAGGVSARAEKVVRNTAILSYEVDGERVETPSNEVSLAYQLRTRADISLMRAFPGADGLTIPETGSQCLAADGAPGPLSIPAKTGTAAASAAVSETLKPARSFRAGDPVFIQVADADRNRDPAVEEEVEVSISSRGGDEEVLLLRETGPDTGIFLGGLQTNGVTPPVRGDCQLLLTRGDTLKVRYTDDQDAADFVESEALVDPLGFVFDSETGEVVDGAVVTLVNAVTGEPAEVFGEDGVSAYPSTVVTGEPVTDASGLDYPARPGGFRFPFADRGDYRLLVQPPGDYVHPSAASPAEIARLPSPDGVDFVIRQGSYGGIFTLTGPEPLRVDIPVDPPGPGTVLVQKAAARAVAEAGDFVQYRVTVQNLGTRNMEQLTIADTPAPGFRYVDGSARLAGMRIADPQRARDGRTLRFGIAKLEAGARLDLTYILAVGAGAAEGDADNFAVATKNGALLSNRARARVRVRPPLMTGGTTIIGRVTVGECGSEAGRTGFAGARIMMEDGRYVITDEDGLYHFEGAAPGTHVVQLDLSSLPPGYEPQACERNTRRAGRAFSSFAEVQGGGIWRTDFVLKRDERLAADRVETEAREVMTDAEAAGGETDWLEGQEPGVDLLFPQPGHNPRAPAQRIAVKHLPGQTASVRMNGAEPGPYAFDGMLGGAERGVEVSRWRGVPLNSGRNKLEVEVHDAQGVLVQTFSRDIWFVTGAAQAELVPEQSQLIADGQQRPRLAVRFTDAGGRPVRAGSLGTFDVEPPYRAALAVDREQARQLAGMETYEPTWRVEGDDGIAYIHLQPTTQTGTVRLDFGFQSGERVFAQELEAWLEPGEQEFVLVGYASGTAGFDTLRNKREEADHALDESFADGEVKLYGKGRVLGKWLVTMAVDSEREDRRGERRRLLGTIDPDRYYTVYGDGSEQRFDAPTSDRLYLRLERKQFYAMYGDFETGLTEAELTRYSRTLTGAKAEYRGETFGFTGFAADTGLRFRREEIQGNGLSGPYRLASRDLVINSDKVAIEVRDRFRSNIVLRREEQTRYIDYDIDPLAGTIRFRRPILSRDPDFNPVFIVVDYETEGFAEQRLNAGGRASARLEGRPA